MLVWNARLKKCQNTELIQSIFSGVNETKVETKDNEKLLLGIEWTSK